MEVNVNGRRSYYPKPRIEEKNGDSQQKTIKSATLTEVCYLSSTFSSSVNFVTLGSFQVAQTTNDSTNLPCLERLPGELYYHLKRKFDISPQFCRHQQTVMYVNVKADYSHLVNICEKIQGTILTVNDTYIYENEIANINKECQTDAILTWVQTEGEHDFRSWCTILLVNGSVAERPCRRPLSCNLCKIKTGLQVTIFGMINKFERNFTVRTTKDGELYLKGYETSIVNKINNSWVLRSNMLEFTCRNNQSALPFVRMNWLCDHETKLLTFSICSMDEFACSDGACLPDGKKCDGKSDCKDESDEKSCKYIMKDPDYDVNQTPTSSSLNDSSTSLKMKYRINIHKIADIKIIDILLHINLSLVFEWKDSRLELMDPGEGKVKLNCSDIWRQEITAVDSWHSVVEFPESISEECSAKLSNGNVLEKRIMDPEMGKRLIFLFYNSLELLSTLL